MPAINIQKRAAQYIQLRDKIAEMEKAHEATLVPYKSLLQEINTDLLNHLDSQKVEAMKTEVGTVYVYEKSSASVADAEAFMKHVIDNQDWDLIERRANVTAVKAYLDASIEKAKADPSVQPGLPPGVNLSRFRMVGVRRA